MINPSRPPALLSAALEELYFALVLFGFRACIEGAEVPVLAGPGIE
jgi:hypothetical protein